MVRCFCSVLTIVNILYVVYKSMMNTPYSQFPLEHLVCLIEHHVCSSRPCNVGAIFLGCLRLSFLYIYLCVYNIFCFHSPMCNVGFSSSINVLNFLTFMMYHFVYVRIASRMHEGKANSSAVSISEVSFIWSELNFYWFYICWWTLSDNASTTWSFPCEILRV